MNNLFTILIAFVPLFSELSGPFDTETVAKYGLLGCVLAWFMVRADKRLGGIEHGMNGLRRTMLIEIFSRPNTSERARLECKKEMRKVAPDLADEMDQSG